MAREVAIGSGITRSLDVVAPQFIEKIREQGVTRPDLKKDLNEVLTAIEPETELKDKAKAAVGAGKFYAGWLPKLVTGEGQRPGSYSEFGPLAEHLRFVERASRKQARATFWD